MENEEIVQAGLTVEANSERLQKAMIGAAELYARHYVNDDRQDIRTDVLNAFYAGAKFMLTNPFPPAQALGSVHRSTLASMKDFRHGEAAKLWPATKAEWNAFEYTHVYSGPTLTVPENVVHKRLKVVLSKKDQGFVMGVLRELGMVHDPRAG